MKGYPAVLWDYRAHLPNFRVPRTTRSLTCPPQCCGCVSRKIMTDAIHQVTRGASRYETTEKRVQFWCHSSSWVNNRLSIEFRSYCPLQQLVMKVRPGMWSFPDSSNQYAQNLNSASIWVHSYHSRSRLSQRCKKKNSKTCWTLRWNDNMNDAHLNTVLILH